MNTMMTRSLPPVFFRSEPQKGHTETTPAAHSSPGEYAADSYELLVCKRCLKVVTAGSERIGVQGAHTHSFTNPHGLFFDIGCFRHAPGCCYAAEVSYEFTWFAGFRWQVAVCRGCMEHLGWLFTSEGSRFNGLILDKIVSVQSGPSGRKF